MAITIKIFFVLTTLLVGDAKEWKPEVYAEGDNVTVRIDALQINDDEVSEINFSGFFSKININNVLMYDPVKMHFNSQSVTINYTGRIRNIKMDKGCLSFLLLRVNWMDSGNYTVFQNFLEKGKTSILVPRRVLVRQDVGSVILPFMCNKANMSSIKIEMIKPIPLAVVIYDVEHKHCTQIEDLYLNRIEKCVLNANNFTFTLQKVSWLDKGTYVAWGDKRFLLDSVNLDIQEGTKFSSPEASKVYITLPSMATEPADSWKVEKGRDLKLTTHTQPDNANVYIDNRQTERNRRLEIDLSGYSVKLHVTHLMLSDPKNDQHDGRSVSRNDTGQIQVIVIDKDSLFFQLLNATFEGNNEFEKSCEKGNAIINVIRSRFVQQGEESGKPQCMYNETDITSNTNNKIQTSLVISSNGTQGIPKDVAQRYGTRIQNCIFSGNNISFFFQESSWLENATFTACDDKGFILQSIYIDVQSSNEYHKLSTGPSSTHGSSNSNGSSNENSVWFWISTIFVVVVAMCLAIFAYRLLRHSRANVVPTSETKDVTYKNRRKPTANGSRNLYMNGNDADTSENSRMFSAKNQSSENLINITNNANQAMIRPKHVNRIPTTTLIEMIAEPCFDYDYVVQHSFMTLRPPAPDPVATKKIQGEVAMTETISWYKRTKERSSSTLHLSTMYANANTKRSRSSYCIISLSEIGSRNVINDLASPGYFDLDNIHATSIMTLSCRLLHCGVRNNGNAENLDSTVLATRPTLMEFSDSDIRPVARLFNYETQSYPDHPPATGRKHRRSQSLGAMMDIYSVLWARRKLARPYIKHKCYDSC